MAQNSNAPRSQEDYITQVSEEIEGRVTKRLSKEFSRTKNRILGALARLDDFLMNPLIQDYSGHAPETSRNELSTNQGTNEDDSQSDPHPETASSPTSWRKTLVQKMNTTLWYHICNQLSILVGLVGEASANCRRSQWSCFLTCSWFFLCLGFFVTWWLLS